MPEDAPTGGQMHRSQLSRSQREAMDRRKAASRAAMPPSGQSLREQRLAESAARKAAGVTLEVPPENLMENPPAEGAAQTSQGFLDRLHARRTKLLEDLEAVEKAINLLESNPEVAKLAQVLDDVVSD